MLYRFEIEEREGDENSNSKHFGQDGEEGSASYTHQVSSECVALKKFKYGPTVRPIPGNWERRRKEPRPSLVLFLVIGKRHNSVQYSRAAAK
jgi:hypothetical protein